MQLSSVFSQNDLKQINELKEFSEESLGRFHKRLCYYASHLVDQDESHNFEVYLPESPHGPRTLSVTLGHKSKQDGFTLQIESYDSFHILDHSTKYIGSILDNINDVILIADAEPITSPGPYILDVNSAFERMTGYSKEEVLGKTPRILQGEDTCRKTRDALGHALENWLPYRCELKNYKKDGTPFWVEIDIVPVADKYGWYVYWVAVQRDLTEQRNTDEKVESRDRQLSAIVKNIPGMVYQFILEPDGQQSFAYVSEKAYDIYKVKAEDFKKNPAIFVELVHEDDRLELQERIAESAQNLAAFEWKGRIKAADGVVRWISAKSTPSLKADGSILWDGVLMDITSEIELEKKYKQQLLITEHQSKLATIGELAAGVGHEINNPLAIMLGKGRTIERAIQSEKVDFEQLKNNLERLRVAGLRIRDIVDGLRKFARSDEGEETFCHANKAIEESITMVGELMHNEGVTIEVQSHVKDHFIACSVGKFQQVLVNLMTNARDALRGQQQKTVSISTKESQGEFQLFVADNGPGIPEPIKSRIFEPFFTSKAAGEGTGLGLAVSKTVLASIGGDLNVHSTDHSGTVFKVSIPLFKGKTDKEDLTSEKTHEKVNGKGLKVLVVDDEPMLLEVIADQFEAFDVVPDTADNVTTALQKVKENQYDMLLTDLRMPGADGYYLISEAHKIDKKKVTQIYVMSGDVDLDDHEIVGKVDGVLRKPFDEEDLGQIIESCLKKNKKK